MKVRGQKSRDESPGTGAKSATHRHCRRPRCCRTPVSSATLRDVASSRRHCNSQHYGLCGCKLAMLRRHYCDGGLSRRAALQRWQVEPTSCSAAMAGRADGLLCTEAGRADGLLCSDGGSSRRAALQRWRVEPTGCSAAMAGRTDGLLCSDGGSNRRAPL
jgi:hypothetical protein